MARGGNIDWYSQFSNHHHPHTIPIILTFTLLMLTFSLSLNIIIYLSLKMSLMTYWTYTYYVFEVANATKNLEILLIEKEFSKKLYLSEVIKMI